MVTMDTVSSIGNTTTDTTNPITNLITNPITNPITRLLPPTPNPVQSTNPPRLNIKENKTNDSFAGTAVLTAFLYKKNNF